MNTRKVSLIALASVAALASGYLCATSLTPIAPAQPMRAEASLYSAEITSSTNIIKARNSEQRYGFQLHGGENYGSFSQSGADSIEVYNSGDYVMSLKTNGMYIMFYLNESDSRSYKVSDSESKVLYAFPGLRTISVTVDEATTGLSLCGWSGADDSFDLTQRVEGGLRTYTLTRNSTPLPTDSEFGNRIHVENATGANQPVKIRSILLTYSC